MALIKTNTEIDKIKTACKFNSKLLTILKSLIVVGNNGLDLEIAADNFFKTNNCKSNFKNYFGYPNNICISLNENLVHGIPNNTPFKEGDIVSVDSGCSFQNYHSDAAFSKIVKKPNSEIDRKLLNTCKSSLDEVIKILKPGVKIGDIGAFIYKFVNKQGFYLPTNYTGHGIGSQMHEKPSIPNVAIPDTGIALRENMTICIEPMLQIGTDKTIVLDDGWTVQSANKKNTAHFEHTILITKNSYQVLTQID